MSTLDETNLATQIVYFISCCSYATLDRVKLGLEVTPMALSRGTVKAG